MRRTVTFSVLLLCAIALSPTMANSEDDCNWVCVDGRYDYVALRCNAGAAVDCANCTVVCPGGGCSPTDPSCCGQAGNPPCDPV
jgi:hypothetical protein